MGHLIDHGLTQALRWNGSVWQPIPVPTPEGGIYDTLYAVSANGSSDVWAVGAADYTHGLTAHWDGTAWTVVPHPRHRNGEEFRGVLTLSSDDAWAVGGQGVFSNEGPLIEHWDGSSWSDVSIPQPEHGGLLLGVDAAGPNDVWAVGLQYAFGTRIYRWNGIEWTMVTKVPYPSTGQLRGVSVISHNDLWVAGLIDAGGPPIAAHWDGSNWKITPVKVGNQWFESVKAFTHTTIWAGGGGAYGVIAARFAGCR